MNSLSITDKGFIDRRESARLCNTETIFVISLPGCCCIFFSSDNRLAFITKTAGDWAFAKVINRRMPGTIKHLFIVILIISKMPDLAGSCNKEIRLKQNRLPAGCLFIQ
jgi:hypothetical protein